MLFYSEMESNVLLMQFPFPPGMEGDSKMVFYNLTHFLYYFAKIVSEEKETYDEKVYSYDSQHRNGPLPIGLRRHQ